MNLEMWHSKKWFVSFAQISEIKLPSKLDPLMDILVVSRIFKLNHLYSTYSPTLWRIFFHI